MASWELFPGLQSHQKLEKTSSAKLKTTSASLYNSEIPMRCFGSLPNYLSLLDGRLISKSKYTGNVGLGSLTVVWSDHQSNLDNKFL
jgi:hypothetical protein